MAKQMTADQMMSYAANVNSAPTADHIKANNGWMKERRAELKETNPDLDYFEITDIIIIEEKKINFHCPIIQEEYIDTYWA